MLSLPWLLVVALVPPAEDSLATRLQPLIDAHKGKVAVAVKHLDSGVGFAFHEDDVMPTASLIKLAVMIEAYRQAHAGELDLNRVLAEDTTERRELVRAIDMVRKRVQRSKRLQAIDEHVVTGPDVDRQVRHQQELGEVLEAARALHSHHLEYEQFIADYGARLAELEAAIGGPLPTPMPTSRSIRFFRSRTAAPPHHWPLTPLTFSSRLSSPAPGRLTRFGWAQQFLTS